MSDFKVEYLTLNPGDLEQADVDFYEVGFYPVIYVSDSKLGELGAVALSGKIRTFPLTSLYSYNARQLSAQDFFAMFPELQHYFVSTDKKAA
jgi:hypothetical protein